MLLIVTDEVFELFVLYSKVLDHFSVTTNMVLCVEYVAVDYSLDVLGTISVYEGVVGLIKSSNTW